MLGVPGRPFEEVKAGFRNQSPIPRCPVPEHFSGERCRPLQPMLTFLTFRPSLKAPSPDTKLLKMDLSRNHPESQTQAQTTEWQAERVAQSLITRVFVTHLILMTGFWKPQPSKEGPSDYHVTLLASLP